MFVWLKNEKPGGNQMNKGNVYSKFLTDKDTVLQSVDYITHLPGGFGQESLPLDIPIKIKKTKTKTVIVEDLLIGDKYPLEDLQPERHCVDCGTLLKPARYRHCTKCVATLPSDCGDEIYCG
jgi:hypothetical protein